MKNFTEFRFTLLLLFSFISTFSQAQQGENYSKIYTTANGMNATAILKTREDKLVISAHHSFSKGIVYQTNLAGEIEWSFEISDSLSLYLNDIQETEDGNYLITGITSSLMELGIYAIKITPNGEEIWSKKIKNDGSNINLIAAKSISLKDSSSIIFSSSMHSGRTLIYKIDNDGNLVWTQNIALSTKLIITDIVEAEDNGLYMCGFTQTTTMLNSMFQGILIHTNSEGEYIWGKKYNHQLFESMDVSESEIKILGKSTGSNNCLQLCTLNFQGEITSAQKTTTPFSLPFVEYNFSKLTKINDQDRWTVYAFNQSGSNNNIGFSINSNYALKHVIEDEINTGIDQIYIDSSTLFRIGNNSNKIKLVRFSSSDLFCDLSNSAQSFESYTPATNSIIDSIAFTTVSSISDYTFNYSPITIEIEEACESNTASLSNQELQKLKLYPNPIEDVLYIENQTSEPQFIQLQNNLGQLIDEYTIAPQTKSQVNTQNLSSGFYTITCKNGERYSVVKL